MNSEAQDETEAAARVDNAVEDDVDMTGAGVDSEERRTIGDAIARGHQVTMWTAAVIALLLIASGLWWAGILVLIVTTFDLPRHATQRYARKRGIELEVPSVEETEKTSRSGLIFGVVFFPALCGLIVAEAKLGHPLLPWSWRTPLYDSDDLYMITPIAVAGLVVTVTWFIRRRRAARTDTTRDE
ncbi:hypothetical protein SAMN04489752_1621 [Brevibacterium siliguriense]|uniref:Uncharacterized protein n=1 Tax=Brevibacterium siliguriense TaxID=1136497 RepID=A0A1H1RUP1_9MICO|nr:hypothetical protein [Brevibacterium siliguriense]SDS39432.1 hypothetical protein SAMN04489752_1621 [Brevibacterium siliguriense]